MKLKILILISYLCLQNINIFSDVNLPHAIPVSDKILDNNSSVSPVQDNMSPQKSSLQDQNLNKNLDDFIKSSSNLPTSLTSKGLPSQPMVDDLPQLTETQNQKTNNFLPTQSLPSQFKLDKQPVLPETENKGLTNFLPDKKTSYNSPSFNNKPMNLFSENPSFNVEHINKNFTNELSDVHEIIEDLKAIAASQKSSFEEKINQTRFLRKKFKSLLKSLIDKLKKGGLTKQNFKIFENDFKIINSSYDDFKKNQNINDLNKIEKSLKAITLLSGSQISTLSGIIE
jgi:hypothetical protein